MKYVIYCLLVLNLISCRKKEQETTVQNEALENRAPYDTIAIDSFSSGATPKNVVIVRKDSLVPVKVKDSAKLSAKKDDPKIIKEKEKAAAAEKDKKLKEDKTKTEAAKKEEKKKEPKEKLEPKKESPKPENEIPKEQPKQP